MTDRFVECRNALRDLIESDALGTNVIVEQIDSPPTYGPAEPVVDFYLTNVDREVALGGFGTIAFSATGASNEQGWSEGQLVCCAPVGDRFLVMACATGTPEYCDDECDGWLSGNAYLFDNEVAAKTFAHGKALNTRLRFCGETAERLIGLSASLAPADLVAHLASQGDETIEWLKSIADAVKSFTY